MEPTSNERFAWISRRVRAGVDDALLDWPRPEVEAALLEQLPPDLAEAVLELFDERRLASVSSVSRTR